MFDLVMNVLIKFLVSHIRVPGLKSELCQGRSLEVACPCSNSWFFAILWETWTKLLAPGFNVVQFWQLEAFQHHEGSVLKEGKVTRRTDMHWI